ncbi:hypothetical protein AGMMS49950_02450 [Endomicrobiia bacterium]|nr:hypothetical protein AGMMS49950_02450 [Endomicrobiia bacterium]
MKEGVDEAAAVFEGEIGLRKDFDEAGAGVAMACGVSLSSPILERISMSKALL